MTLYKWLWQINTKIQKTLNKVTVVKLKTKYSFKLQNKTDPQSFAKACGMTPRKVLVLNLSPSAEILPGTRSGV